MILHIAMNGSVRLHEPVNFRRLHCEFAMPPACRARAHDLLQGIAHLDGDDAWIDIGWLRSQAPSGDAAWPSAFEQMIAQARPYGWVSADGLQVKAHVIWTAPDLSGTATLQTRT